jgi:hypothetical protein
MDWNRAVELKIGSAQGLNRKKQGASARETSEFRKFHKKRWGTDIFNSLTSVSSLTLIVTK